MNNDVTFEDLLDAAEREDWKFIDSNINASHLVGDRIRWMMNEGLKTPSKPIRNFAAILLNKSDYVFNRADLKELELIMLNDRHHIVRHRLAIYFYKKGNRTPNVIRIMESACHDLSTGSVARELFKKPAF